MLEMFCVNFSFSLFNGILRFDENTIIISLNVFGLLATVGILFSLRGGEESVVLLIESKAHSLQLLLPLCSKLFNSLNLLGIDKEWCFILIERWKCGLIAGLFLLGFSFAEKRNETFLGMGLLREKVCSC